MEIGARDPETDKVITGGDQLVLKRHGYDKTWSKSVSVPPEKAKAVAADFFLWTTVAEGTPPDVWRFLK